MNALTFVENALALFKSGGMKYEINAWPDGTIMFEKSLPKLSLLIRVIGPERPKKSKGQHYVTVNLIETEKDTEEPIIELLPTAIQNGWGTKLLRRLRTLEIYLKEKFKPCGKCNGNLTARMKVHKSKTGLLVAELYCDCCGRIVESGIGCDSYTVELNKILLRNYVSANNQCL